MVRRRGGRSTLGCLVVLLLVVAAVYFAVNVGEVYLRFFAFRDFARQEARFGRLRTDEQIRARFAAKADSLGLPAEAGLVRVSRGRGVLLLTSEYTEHVELPMLVRDIDFRIREEGPL
jgi:hypothetical protein